MNRGERRALARALRKGQAVAATSPDFWKPGYRAVWSRRPHPTWVTESGDRPVEWLSVVVIGSTERRVRVRCESVADCRGHLVFPRNLRLRREGAP